MIERADSEDRRKRRLVRVTPSREPLKPLIIKPHEIRPPHPAEVERPLKKAA